MEEPLRAFLSKYKHLYLDKKGPRPLRGKSRKVSWVDKNGNTHDLDIVIERGGTPHSKGSPSAFIEIAWRRYTKHSRNKAQEIQGAILPLVETYANYCPFIGAILAGVFTEGSLKQLESLGFKILFFDYETIINAFNVCGINAYYGEDTPDQEVKAKVEAFNALSEKEKDKIEKTLRDSKKKEIDEFINSLEKMVARKIESIRIIVLHGKEYNVNRIEDAIQFIEKYDIKNASLPFFKFEIFILYSNGDKVEAKFIEKENAISFLKNNT